MRKRNNYFKLDGIPHKNANKHTRIENALYSRFKSNSIFFPQEADWLAELLSELAGITRDGIKSEHDDLVDALSMTAYLAIPPRKAGGVNERVDSYADTIY